jgi:hypothetical protein
MIRTLCREPGRVVARGRGAEDGSCVDQFVERMIVDGQVWLEVVVEVVQRLVGLVQGDPVVVVDGVLERSAAGPENIVDDVQVALEWSPAGAAVVEGGEVDERVGLVACHADRI